MNLEQSYVAVKVQIRNIRARVLEEAKRFDPTICRGSPDVEDHDSNSTSSSCLIDWTRFLIDSRGYPRTERLIRCVRELLPNAHVEIDFRQAAEAYSQLG